MNRLVILTGALVTLLLVSTISFAQSKSRFDQPTSREKLVNQINAKRKELTVLEQELLSPSAQDQARFAGLVKGREGGLIRLMPREIYEQSNTGFGIRGGGAYYSFTKLTHEYGYGSDISLGQNSFSTGFAGADYGILTNLGDVPFEKIDQNNAALKFMVNHEVPMREPGARVEQRRFAEGSIENGIPFKRTLGVALNNTYLLRSINYGGSDVLVAFRPVRRDIDRSLIIAWVLLKEYPVPELFRQTADAR